MGTAQVSSREARGIEATKEDALAFLKSVGVAPAKVGKAQWRSWLRTIESAVDSRDDPPDDASDTTAASSTSGAPVAPVGTAAATAPTAERLAAHDAALRAVPRLQDARALCGAARG